jgi:hypothetical protein
MKKIILSNSNLIKSNNSRVNKIFDFKDISKVGNKLAESIDPIKNIKKLTSNKNPEDIMPIRLSELSKYKLSLFLNRELQQEILVGGDLTSSKINNQIVAAGFTFSEDKTNNLFLHKRIEDYFVLIHFRYLKPNKDKKRIINYKNEAIEDQYKKFGVQTGIFHKLTGAEHNPDFLTSEKEDLYKQGAEYEEERYKDLTPFYFNINLINKKSETLQYVCFSEETKVNFI